LRLSLEVLHAAETAVITLIFNEPVRVEDRDRGKCQEQNKAHFYPPVFTRRGEAAYLDVGSGQPSNVMKCRSAEERREEGERCGRGPVGQHRSSQSARLRAAERWRFGDIKFGRLTIRLFEKAVELGITETKSFAIE
jgi:hypothetical protein